MKRRDFLKTSAAAAGLAGSLTPLQALKAGEMPGTVSDSTATAPADDRPADYLRRVQGRSFLRRLTPASSATNRVSPMPPAERVKRNIVPRHGFCSTAPGTTVGECLISGNGTMNIELMGEPYSEQVLFHHESLLMPWKRPLEAPKVADIFPQVRQMVLEGNHGEAMSLAVERMSASPIKQSTEPHLTIPAFLMRLDFPKSSAVKDYLRTVAFETGELNVHWSDDRGEWVRQTFASRPENVVVQRLAAPAGQSVNVRISLQKSAQWSMNNGMTWGGRPTRGAVQGRRGRRSSPGRQRTAVDLPMSLGPLGR